MGVKTTEKIIVGNIFDFTMISSFDKTGLVKSVVEKIAQTYCP